MKNAISFLFLMLVGILVGMAVMFYFYPRGPLIQEETKTESNVILEQVQKVMKMVTVEGQFADILSHESDEKFYGLSIPGFKKKALLKVKAKVSVGYDLENVQMDLDHTNHIIRISNLPEPEIIATDMDLSYYDIDEGVFNSFSPKELTSLNQAAKDSIVQSVHRSSLMEVAREQADDLFVLVEAIAEQGGWKVVVGGPKAAENLKFEELPSDTIGRGVDEDL